MLKRQDPVPDLEIDLGPPLRLCKRRARGGAALFGEAAVAVTRRVLALFALAILAAFMIAVLPNWLSPRGVHVEVPATVAYPTGQEERDEADERAALALNAQGDADEAKDRRLRESSRLINPVMTLLRSEDVDGGRTQAFLQLTTHGEHHSVIVEGGVLREYAGEDRYHWATATPEELAVLWAGRGRDGDFRAKSATREAFGLSAVVVDRTRGRRWKLEMNGFDANGGAAVVAMTPIDP